MSEEHLSKVAHFTHQALGSGAGKPGTFQQLSKIFEPGSDGAYL